MDSHTFPELLTKESEPDWSYAMRRQMQEIIPHIYLGPYAAAMKSSLAELQRHHITHIICIRQNVEAHFIHPNFQDQISYLVLDVADSVTENIIKFIPQVCSFIDGCLQCNGSVLIHGNAGISRSAAIVMSYIMEKYGLSYKQTFEYVQQRRYCINPNEGFVNQLTEYELMHRARISLGKDAIGSGQLKRKRSFEDLYNNTAGAGIY